MANNPAGIIITDQPIARWVLESYGDLAYSGKFVTRTGNAGLCTSGVRTGNEVCFSGVEIGVAYLCF